MQANCISGIDQIAVGDDTWIFENSLLSSVSPCTLLNVEGLSKNFSFWTASLDLDAMFKIKSLLYKDLILNSSGMFRK